MAKSAPGAEGVPYFIDGQVAARHGVPLAAAIHAGLMTPDDYRALLAQCARCTDGAGVGNGLAPDCDPPPWCGNKTLLEGLRAFL